MGVVNFAASTGGRYVNTIEVHDERRQVPYATRLAQQARESGLMQRAFFRNSVVEAWQFVCAVYPDMNKFVALPSQHRLYPNVGWTGMGVLGGIDKRTERHTDSKMGDIPGVILVLGGNLTGGTTIYHGNSVSIKILHKNGLMHAARYGAIPHEASDWKGL